MTHPGHMGIPRLCLDKTLRSHGTGGLTNM